MRLVPFSVGLRHRFRGVTHREGVLLEGPAGWGEFSPFAEYGPAYAARWLASAIEAATTAFPDARRSSVPVNTTVPAVDAATAARLVRDSACSTAKVKVAETGQQLADDVERLAAVRDALGADGCIRVDANGAWDVQTAVFTLARLDAAAGGLEYVEQPCATVAELAEVRRRTDVLVAADESIRTADDPLRVVRAGAADLLVLKVQPMGGVSAAMEVAAACGLPVVASSAVETSVGLAAGVAFAAALEELSYACGLGTATLLAADVTASPLVPDAGAVTPRRVAPDDGMLDAAAPAPREAERLLNRLRAAAAHLPAALRARLEEQP